MKSRDYSLDILRTIGILLIFGSYRMSVYYKTIKKF